MMSKEPKDFRKVILLLANLLRGWQYAFRGTASLVLQGIEMNVDDIDILSDEETALACNKLLEDSLLEKVVYKESDKFRSYFGKFEVNSIPVEVMGEWQIKDNKGNWGRPFNGSESEREKLTLDGQEVYVTKVETELFMFARMGRWTAYHKIKRQLKPKEGKSQQELF